MDLSPHKVGILLSSPPDSSPFREGVQFAAQALAQGQRVFLYCIHDAVTGISDPALQTLHGKGLVLHACAFAAQRRGLPINDLACFGGLGILGDLLAGTDEFQHFGETWE